ncbi:hypothetical protein BD410DRAFT_867774 [Rickenella mellea]|uniref:Uncharacterized protein n=1 Tax=Rickenella mellea TaxID=50990 RepID=A0A4Y7Q1Z1_9AGAM|nr:hypothetical protein BD410DRAFT_867774 [Rickenella mellea]
MTKCAIGSQRWTLLASPSRMLWAIGSTTGDTDTTTQNRFSASDMAGYRRGYRRLDASDTEATLPREQFGAVTLPVTRTAQRVSNNKSAGAPIRDLGTRVSAYAFTTVMD